MAAAVWTACTKTLLFAEKSETPERDDLLRGFCCFTVIFEGCSEKCGVQMVVFGGGFVVICMVNCGASWSLIWDRKIRHVFALYF
jgi:hypothetical protein